MSETQQQREDRIASAMGQGLNPKDSIDDYGDDEETDHNRNEEAVAYERIDMDDNSKGLIIYPLD